jgi:hypothetical protein
MSSALARVYTCTSLHRSGIAANGTSTSGSASGSGAGAYGRRGLVSTSTLSLYTLLFLLEQFTQSHIAQRLHNGFQRLHNGFQR